MSGRSQDSATPVGAILYMVATYVLFTFLDTTSKYVVLAGVTPLFAAWVRFAGHVILVAILFRSWRDPARFIPASLVSQGVRGAFLAMTTIFNFLALRTLQLAETTSIYFFGPMVITALAGPLLGERAGWRRWMAILVGFIGVLVITRPGVGAFGLGHVFALGAVLSNSFYVIMTRRMSASETVESLIFYSALAPAVLLTPLVFLNEWPSLEPSLWGLLLLLGVFGGLGHWCLIKAYSQATTTALAPYPYLQMIWIILAGWLVFNQLPDGWTLAGCGIIVSSGLYIMARERQLRVRNRAVPGAETEVLVKKL